MLKTASEIAKISHRQRQAVNNYLKRNSIPPAGKKGKYDTYDVDKEPLKSYLGIKSPAPKKPPAKPPPETADTPPPDTPPPQPKAATNNNILKPLNALIEGRMPPGSTTRPATYLYAKAMKAAEDNNDPAMYLKLAQLASKEERDYETQQQMLKTMEAKEQSEIEKSKRLKIENEIRTGMYIEHETVKILFGRVYAVHTSTLTPLSLKLASTLAAIPPGDQKEATMRKLIDDEIFSALATINRLLIEFVQDPA